LSLSPFHPEVNFLRGHGPGVRIARVFAKRAVRAPIAAEISDREKNLARIGDSASLMSVSQRAGGSQQGGNLIVRAVDEPIALFR
jgi:hypothetical protein